MALEQEMAFFKKNLADWLKHYEGQFALVVGARLVGTYTTFEQAYEAGVKECGTGSFLVKMVQAAEGEVQYPALAVGVLYARA